jgi:hypothetical protein
MLSRISKTLVNCTVLGGQGRPTIERDAAAVDRALLAPPPEVTLAPPLLPDAAPPARDDVITALPSLVSALETRMGSAAAPGISTEALSAAFERFGRMRMGSQSSSSP